MNMSMSSMCTAGPASRSSLNSGCGWASAVEVLDLGQRGVGHDDPPSPTRRQEAASARTVVFSAGTIGGASFHDGMPSSGLAAG